MMYATQKLDVLISKKDVDILSTVKESYFDDKDIFSHRNGLNVAVAFTAYDNEREWILDPSFGSLIFNAYSWGPRDDGTYVTERKQLKSHVCTPDELNISHSDDDDDDDDNKAKFLKARPSSNEFVRANQKKLLCLNKEDIYVYGDFNSYNARQLNIQLVKCKGGEKAGCKSDKSILEFFRNKFLVIYSN